MFMPKYVILNMKAKRLSCIYFYWDLLTTSFLLGRVAIDYLRLYLLLFAVGSNLNTFSKPILNTHILLKFFQPLKRVAFEESYVATYELYKWIFNHFIV